MLRSGSPCFALTLSINELFDGPIINYSQKTNHSAPFAAHESGVSFFLFFSPSHGFSPGKNKSTYNSCNRGSKSYSSIDNERSAPASYETSGKPGIDQERSSVPLYLQEGWFAGFWKHKAPFETRSQLCYRNSQFRPCFWCRSVYFQMSAALHAGCGALLFRQRPAFLQKQLRPAVQNGPHLAVLINIWQKKRPIQKQERVCKNGPLCDSIAQRGSWSESVLLWQVTH